MNWISFIIIVLVILAHIINPAFIILDKYSVILLSIISVPFLAPYLKSLKFLGTQFDFNDSIKRIETYTKDSIKKSEEIIKNDSAISEEIKINNSFPSAFSLEKSIELLDEDPSLSLAAVRMEIEKSILKLHILCDNINGKQKQRFSVSEMIRNLQKEGFLRSEQVNALKEILLVCNKAIHGSEVSYDQAKNTIMLTEELGRSFNIGYVPNLKPNNNFEEQGLFCEWQHCIELSPFTREVPNLSCHIFGHDCPGGINRQLSCKKDWKLHQSEFADA